mgnify:CR=1 FL=1
MSAPPADGLSKTVSSRPSGRSGPPPAPGEGAAEAEPALDERAQRRAEVESFLGDAVRTPDGIPDGYMPTERSIHPLFHVELSELTFAGPLDLLLYLVRKHRMDVFDVPIARLTDAYLQMLSTFEALEIDVAAEFLVLAAELTHIKSKMLLPAEEGVAVEEPPEAEEQGDPRAELVRRLLEYQKYRDAAAQLADRDQLGRDVFARVPPPMGGADDVDPGLKPVNVFRLVELMARLLREVPAHHEISYESFSIAERIQYVTAFGEAHDGRFTVLDLMRTTGSRAELVVTFIGLLEMGKMGLVRIGAERFHQAGAHEAEETTEARSAEGRGAGAAEGSQRRAEGEAAQPPAESPAADPDEGPSEAAEPAQDTRASPPAATAEPAPTEAVEAEARAVHREAEALEALAREAEAQGPLGEDAVAWPAAPLEHEPASEADLEPLPEIWVELTERRFQGDLIDDYR